MSKSTKSITEMVNDGFRPLDDAGKAALKRIEDVREDISVLPDEVVDKAVAVIVSDTMAKKSGRDAILFLKAILSEVVPMIKGW